MKLELQWISCVPKLELGNEIMELGNEIMELGNENYE